MAAVVMHTHVLVAIKGIKHYRNLIYLVLSTVWLIKGMPWIAAEWLAQTQRKILHYY